MLGVGTAVFAATDDNGPYVSREEKAIYKQIKEWEPELPDADTLAAFAEKLLDQKRLCLAGRVINMLAEQDGKRAAPLRKRIQADTSILGRWTFKYGREMHETGASFRCVKGGKVCALGRKNWTKQIGAWEQIKPGEYRVRLIRQGKSVLGLQFVIKDGTAKGTAVDREYKRKQTWPAKGSRSFPLR